MKKSKMVVKVPEIMITQVVRVKLAVQLPKALKRRLLMTIVLGGSRLSIARINMIESEVA